MTTITQPTTPFRLAREGVLALLERDTAFEHVEAYVESAPDLDEIERAMLWVLAYFEGDMLLVATELGRPDCSSGPAA